jgi:hypothetical protein
MEFITSSHLVSKNIASFEPKVWPFLFINVSTTIDNNSTLLSMCMDDKENIAKIHETL